ncbi:MAG: heavy metal-binding domain-containing protein [Candidatus Sumerlaeia bacterium]|nr:heavy metal-binding domain-containing protein [Candidatus Sumerlaeia bacterium]
MEILIPCLFFLFPLVLFFFVGTFMEKRHLKSLEEREAKFSNFLVTDVRGYVGGAHPKASGTLVAAEVVVAIDYFKSFVASLYMIVGGEVRVHRSLMERARREAILRIREEASQKGYNAICNLRMETMDLTVLNPKQKTAMVAVTAYGTAYHIPPKMD